MNDELQNKLYDKYPKIFINKSASKYESALYWGLCCGEGWYNLITNLCENLQKYLDEHPEVPQVVATQVKEKFGTLCFYTEGGDGVTRQMEIDAVNLSGDTCENCGSTEEVTSTRGWITNLCKTCMAEHNERKLAAK
jgi:hypothetical protein